MEDDDETLSPIASSDSQHGGALAEMEMVTELSTDVEVGSMGDKVEEERESIGDGDGVAGDGVEGRVEGERERIEDGDGGGDVAGHNDVADKSGGSSEGNVDGERESIDGGDVEETVVAKGEELGFSGIGSEQVDMECVEGLRTSGVVSSGNNVVKVGEGKREEHGSSGIVPSLGELKPVDEVVGDKIDGEDAVLKENVRDLEVIKGSADVAVEERDSVVVDSEAKSGEEGETEKLMAGDEMDGKDEVVVGEVLGNSEAILGNDDVVVSEADIVVVGSGGEGEFGSVPKVERENLSTGAEIVVESVEKEVAVDTEMGTEKEAVVDTEMETEEEVKEDVVVEERGFSQMEVEDEVVRDDDDEAMGEEDDNLADTEDTDVAEVAEEEKGRGKKKREKNSRVSSKAPAKKVIEEDVCFICFDGGDLVLCDRRGCPKAYHPTCVNRDEAFFRAKGRWNCGWHQCTICEKNAQYMCYTCPFSLCKACRKDADAAIYCVRGNKGFCEICIKTVSLIENSEKGINEDQVDFDDKTSWLYLFKDYWLNVKKKLSLSAAEISQANNLSKGSDAVAGKRESPDEAVGGSNHQDSSSNSEENVEAGKNKRRKTKKRLKSRTKEETSPVAKEDLPPPRKLMRSSTFGTEVTFKQVNTEWASKELLGFVMHMKNGDKSAISQFDVQALLLEYIKTNKLRDPRRKSQIICDARLQSLFGKPRVGHFEMLKLLESHFLIKENSQTDDNQGTVVDEESNELDADGTTDTTPKVGKDKRRKGRKKGHNRGRQSNLDDYAAIDMHNIGLIFLRRKLVEDLLEDDETFCDKAVGTFVRIRISASTQKQDMYRLVKVLGTSKAEEPYKVGKRITNLMLEILNLNKKELVSIDTISNQDFTEEECTRLRQSIKCGLISRLTVGDILDKATEIQAARVSDWLEAEVVRVSHLRDRASDLGRRKELRECVEKLQLLKTPEERRRRLDEIPEIHADPNMDPDHESEEHDSGEEDSKQESFTKPRGSAFSRRGREPISPRGGNYSSVDSWSGSRQNSGKNFEVTRNLSNIGFSNKNVESASTVGIPIEGAHRYIETQANMEKAMSPINSVNAGQSSISFARSESFSSAGPEILQPSLPVVPEAAININESEKMWNYKDPAGKAQGPFSIVQLRKWSKNGYFPADLRIWKTKETEDISILLTDALEGIFDKQLVLTKTNPSPAHTLDQNIGLQSQIGTNSSNAWGSLSVEVPKHSNKSSNSFNPPSPTPNTSTPISLTVQPENFAPGNQNGIQENASPASLLNSATQIMSSLENGSTSSLVGLLPVVRNIAQQAPATNETQGWGTQQMVIPYQTAPDGPQATVGVTHQNTDPNSSYSMPIQQAGHNPWLGAVPTTVQNPPGTFPVPGYAAMPHQPMPGQQPTYPMQVAPNVPWGMGMVQGNPNMGWGMGMVQANPNMNWAPMVNPGWVAPNPGAIVNQGWIAQPVVNQGAGSSVAQGPPPGNVNPMWGPPNGTTNTQAPSVNVNQVRGTGIPPGNTSSGKGNSGNWGSPPGNTNSGQGNSGNWGTPPGNSGGRRNNEGYRSGGNRFSGPRDRERGGGGGGGNDGRHFLPKHYDNHGNRICPFFLEGYCRKESRCDMVHQNLPDKM